MESNYKERSSLRQKADYASKFRCNTFICVIENPRNLANVAAIVRNIDTLGIAKLYVVDGFKILKKEWEDMRKDKHLNVISSSAIKWAYVKTFDTTEECYDHLKDNNYVSMVTSPHISDVVNNISLSKGVFTQKKLAIWFGNESGGISDEAISKSIGCVQIETAGIVESLNLSVSTGIVLYFIAQQRRQFLESKDDVEKVD